MISIAKNIVRSLFRTQGIELISISVRFGFDPWIDVQRIARAWGVEIESVFDVGANDGETTSLFLQNFPTCRVSSFEPQVSVYEKLAARFHDEQRVHTANSALSNHEGVIRFYQYGNNKIASMSPNAPYAVRFGEAPVETTVPCTTVDEYCNSRGIDRIDILKIDTEGNDHLVLEGASRMLSAGQIRFVYVEFNTLEPVDGQFGGSLMLMNRLLPPAGFRLVSTYLDYLVVEQPMFSVSNALFALPPTT